MDPKEWFNLRQLYRNRFSAATTKMDSKLSLACCKKGVRMCCGRVGGVVGVVGAVLILLGLTQLVAGIYFMLVLPIFQLGSNIWTGTWTGVCGTVVGIIGWRKQTMRRGQMVLVATLSVLVANVANLVILQVGEKGVFLSDDDLRIIVENNQDTALMIAFWLTTALTAMGIVVSFFGAQYLFCVVVRGPKVKGRMPVTRTLSEEGLHHRQVETTRFHSPSLAAANSLNSVHLALSSTEGTGLRNDGTGDGVNVHGFPGDGDNPIRSSSNCVMNSSNGSENSNQEVSVEVKRKRTKTSEPKTPENSVPYFLRNHRSAWQFILPEVVREMKQNYMYSCNEPFISGHSRTSTLSKASKSSFQPFRPNNIESEVNQPNVLGPEHQQNNFSKASSSCNTSLYSIPETCRQPDPSPRPVGRVTRPSEPPPSPPTFSSSANLRSVTTGGWESCAVIQYPSQAGGGFVVDLD